MIDYKAIIGAERARLEGLQKPYADLADERGWNALDKAERAKFDALDMAVRSLDRVQSAIFEAESKAIDEMAASYEAEQKSRDEAYDREMARLDEVLRKNGTYQCSSCGRYFDSSQLKDGRCSKCWTGITVVNTLAADETTCSSCGGVFKDDEIVFVSGDDRLCDDCDRERIAQELRDGERP